VIVRIGNRNVASAQDVSRTVTELVPGTRVPFVVLRAGTSRETVQVTVAERPLTSG
jgi:S1-C subfamily serine protease